MLKKDVLRGKKVFSTVYNKGKSYGGRYVILFLKKNEFQYNRTGFLASKKVGNSVVRNRARRLMKESFRTLGPNVSIGYDLIMIARNTITNKKCTEVLKDMEALYKKAGLLKT